MKKKNIICMILIVATLLTGCSSISSGKSNKSSHKKHESKKEESDKFIEHISTGAQAYLEDGKLPSFVRYNVSEDGTTVSYVCTDGIAIKALFDFIENADVHENDRDCDVDEWDSIVFNGDEMGSNGVYVAYGIYFKGDILDGNDGWQIIEDDDELYSILDDLVSNSSTTLYDEATNESFVALQGYYGGDTLDVSIFDGADGLYYMNIISKGNDTFLENFCLPISSIKPGDNGDYFVHGIVDNQEYEYQVFQYYGELEFAGETLNRYDID